MNGKVTTAPGDPSCSTEDKPSTDTRVTEYKMTSLLSAVAGISMVDVAEKQANAEFTVASMCYEVSVLRAPRQHECVDKEFKNRYEMKTFAERLL